jgi:mRNA interferase HigB
MEVYGEEQLSIFSRKHSQARGPLNDWLKTARKLKWRNIIELRAVYSSADGGIKGCYTVFNIKGNDYRLVIIVNYKAQYVRVLRVFTHAEYTKWSRL